VTVVVSTSWKDPHRAVMNSFFYRVSTENKVCVVRIPCFKGIDENQCPGTTRLLF